MLVQRNWDRLNKITPVGQYIKEAYKSLPEWKPWSDDAVDSETFGPFGLYYHMMTKAKQNVRAVESDIVSMYRNSKGEWFPEELSVKDYFAMLPNYLNAKMHQKINPDLSMKQAAQMPYLTITENAEQLHQMVLLGLLGPMFAEEMTVGGSRVYQQGVWTQEMLDEVQYFDEDGVSPERMAARIASRQWGDLEMSGMSHGINFLREAFHLDAYENPMHPRNRKKNEPETVPTLEDDPRIMVSRDTIWNLPNFDSQWVSMAYSYLPPSERDDTFVASTGETYS